MARGDLIAPIAVSDTGDIQALVTAGFGSLTAACFLMLRVAEATAAKAWLAGVQVATVADLGKDKPPLTQVVQVALTSDGLAALGLDPAIIAQFAPEFVRGLARDASRSRRLGDVGDSAPAHWHWGSGDRTPHLAVLLYASDAGALTALEAATEAGLGGGFSIVTRLHTANFAGREPFGFMDGISQPSLDWQGRHQPGSDHYANTIAAGEVLIGYPNEYGRIADRPLLPGEHTLPAAIDDPGWGDLGRNGSYLVHRELAQDVRGFWRWVGREAPDAALPLAEAMVGRRIDGQPLAGLATHAIAGEPRPDSNGFTYDADRDGMICPHGGHIRRSNPRNGDFPVPPRNIFERAADILGLRGKPEADAIASARFHRLLRRGREYGQWLDREAALDQDAPDPQSGINFLCLGASIGRQFEFVQGAWCESAKFGGGSGESDPLLGSRAPFPDEQATDGFTRGCPAGPRLRHDGVPRFVTVKGGAYFLLPGVKALRFIAS